MITIHEFGHYIAGKILKFKINEFAIGMGPAIIKKKKKNGEIFSIRLLPIGGFCAFSGESDEENLSDSFYNKKPWERIIVLLSGVLFNFILGIVLITMSIGIYGQVLLKVDSSYGGLEDNSIIKSVNNVDIFSSEDVYKAILRKNVGDYVKVEIVKNGKVEEKKVQIVEEKVKTSSDYFNAYERIGIMPHIYIVTGDGTYFKEEDYVLKVNGVDVYSVEDFTLELKKTNTNTITTFRNDNEENIEVNYDFSLKSEDEILEFFGMMDCNYFLMCSQENVKFDFFPTIGRGFSYSMNLAKTIYKFLGELFTGKIGLESFGGPITTVKTTSEMINQGGFNYFLLMAGYMGINLCIFNLLPIPALDGFKVIFTIIEWIRKKPINKKVEMILTGIGLVLLFGFCIFVDIYHLI